jgi:hypothetical protein
LQVHSSRGPIGQPVTVPKDVSSVTVIFRDTEGLKSRTARRAEKRGKTKPERAGGRARRAKGGEDDDED